MNRHALLVAAVPFAVLLVAAAGCAAPPGAAVGVPAALQPPAGSIYKGTLHAEGVQIYRCAAPADKPGTFAWTLVAPEAKLIDRDGRDAGTHGAGPHWTAPDGSRVTARLAARDDGPDARAIPWLLLAATPSGESGLFGGVRSIQRIRTVGGRAPGDGCAAEADVGRTVRVTYRADYVFYTAPAAPVRAANASTGA